MAETLSEMITPTFASIFDWQGPRFLAFYAIAFLIAVLWSLVRRRTVLGPLNPAPGSQPALEDPIEIAYLAGGASRCTEVALVNLIEKGVLSWKPGGLLKRGTLKVENNLPADCHWFERAIFSAVTANGMGGIPLQDLSPAIRRNMAPLEGRLASLGLRPTSSELSGKGTSAILPLMMLFIVGLIKLAIGFYRGMPVGFLIAFLIITFIAMFVITKGVKKLTPAGQNLLDQMRAGRQSSPHPGLASVALFGIAGATSYAGMPEIDPNMISELNKMSTTHTHSNGCGGTGCGGGSGCGGGGCGGCGGCGG